LEAALLEIEIVGNEDAIDEAKRQIGAVTTDAVRSYRHRGAAGEAGIFGILTSIVTSALPNLLDLLKPLVARDRTLKVSINGLEISVRDVDEAKDVLELLKKRGLLPNGA
jgi:pentatricopeptide repeat protein